MIEIKTNSDGTLKAVCEWYLVDSRGNYSSHGDYVWVNEVYINPEFRSNGMLKEFVKDIIAKAPTAKYGYFWRQKKYKGRKPRIYSKERWLKLIGGKND